MKFIKHVAVIGNEIATSLFDDVSLQDIYTKMKYIGANYLVIRNGDDDYTFNLDRFLTNERVEVVEGITIKNIVSMMTEQLLYTYAEPALNNFENQLVILSHGDYRSSVSMSASNKALDEDSPLINDPGFQDISIRIPNVDLANVIPVIGNTIYMPQWSNGTIFIDGAARILLDNPELVLMTTTEGTEIAVESAEDIDSIVQMREGFVPVLILDGRLMIPSEKYLDIQGSDIRLSQVARDKLISLSVGNYDPKPNTFIMFFKANRLLNKSIYTSDVAGSIVEFCDASRLVIVTDNYGYVHSCVTKEFKSFDTTRQYCYTDVVKPNLNQFFLI